MPNFAMITRVMLLCVFALLCLPQTGAAQVTGGPPPPPPPPSSGSNDRDDDRRPATTVPDNVAQLRGDTPEFVVSGPIGTAPAAVAALESAGARLLQFRDLASLGRRVMLFDLGARLDLPEARALLFTSDTGHLIDFNNLYTYAQGTPRQYAASMVGDGRQGACRLGAGRRLGLIDGPVDTTHPTLQNAGIVPETALSGFQRAPDTAHGTAVAALLVGQDATGLLSGFAAGARLYAVNAFAREHSGVAADVDRIAASLNWLLGNDVRVINMSFAGPQNEVFADILRQAQGKGALMIAAAGNDGRDRAVLPAASDAVIAVTAVDAAMRRYRSANRGPHIEFAAPGVDLFVARGGSGGYASGTSYAAPIITALSLRSGARDLATLRTRLRQAALDLGSPGRDSEFGWGLVRNIGC